MGLRRQAREAALQALYACDFVSQLSVDAASFCMKHFNIPDNVQEYALTLVSGVIEHRNQIDTRITCASDNWSMTRMSRVDRNILRVGAFELMFLADVPVSVAINEAIEIAKRFGADESPNFINGVLDRLANASNSGGSSGSDGDDAPAPLRAVR